VNRVAAAAAAAAAADVAAADVRGPRRPRRRHRRDCETYFDSCCRIFLATVRNCQNQNTRATLFVKYIRVLDGDIIDNVDNREIFISFSS
jgi:hypothetical protein